MKGIERIAKERQRQIDKEGWTAEHDDHHNHGDLSAAARCYTLCAWRQLMGKQCGWTDDQFDFIILEREWPWDRTWWKPSPDPIRNLEKAGALISAEIDKLQRMVKP
jgi:hypothetical protein